MALSNLIVRLTFNFQVSRCKKVSDLFYYYTIAIYQFMHFTIKIEYILLKLVWVKNKNKTVLAFGNNLICFIVSILHLKSNILYGNITED